MATVPAIFNDWPCLAQTARSTPKRRASAGFQLAVPASGAWPRPSSLIRFDGVPQPFEKEFVAEMVGMID